jgi:hypothetical protein
MATRLAQVLDAAALGKLLDERTPVETIVANLFAKGAELAGAVAGQRYGSYEEFAGKHAAGSSELVELEGPSDLRADDIVILKGCPMSAEMKKLGVNGTPPLFYRRIVDDYMEQNPGANAILHPGCIAHQVARQLIVKHIDVGGRHDLNYYQLACRNMSSGEVVYDDGGLAAIGMTKDKAAQLIAGCACLYVMVKNQQPQR